MMISNVFKYFLSSFLHNRHGKSAALGHFLLLGKASYKNSIKSIKTNLDKICTYLTSLSTKEVNIFSAFYTLKLILKGVAPDEK
jgi:hypothetical protein